MQDRIREIQSILIEIGKKLRCNDQTFPNLSIEDRPFYNALGKLIELIGRFILEYRWVTSEEEKLEIRKKVINLWKKIEEEGVK